MIEERCKIVAEIVAREPDEQWLIWCGLNAESELLTRLIPDAVEVTGSHDADYKERTLLGFADGDVRVLVSKASICGHGMNFQRAARMVFCGISDSFEQMFQALRREYRYGQTREVHCHVVTASTEGAVVRNVERKERQWEQMMDETVSRVAPHALGRQARDVQPYEHDDVEGDGWRLMLGDSVHRLAEIEDESVGLTVTSPPFPGMWIYTNSPHDMGNVRDTEEMIEQFRFLIPELLRVTMPGRSCCVHLTQGTAQKVRDGYIGIRDFRGKVIEAMESEGWIYYGEVCIDTNPQMKAVRTKDRGLLFKSLANDSANMHMALAEYLLQFRKRGENPQPIRAGISEKYGNPDGWITNDEWIEWAAPVWYRQTEGYPGGIRASNVLNVAAAREEKDERHLCPLSLDIIERAVKLWSAPGDLVLDPFNGIGSTGVVALKHGRHYVGGELKRSYWEQSARNLAVAKPQISLLDAATQ
jgi:DNA modification methylase